MTFEELVAGIKKIPCKEVRAQAEHYFEVVVDQEHFEALNTVLHTYFGPALKPKGTAPTGDSNRYSDKYGGIRRDQILYVHPKDKGADVALLWPWGSSSSRVTLKLVRG